MDTDIVGMGVMSQDIILCDSFFTDSHDFKTESVKDEALVTVLAEYHFLTVSEDNGPVGPVFLIRYCRMGAVIEYHAVGQHLHDRCTVMRSCRHHYLLIQLEFAVQSAGKEGPFGSEDKAARIERMLYRTVRGCLGDGPEL